MTGSVRRPAPSRPPWLRAVLVLTALVVLAAAAGAVGGLVREPVLRPLVLPAPPQREWPSVSGACGLSFRTAVLDEAAPAFTVGPKVTVGTRLTQVDLGTGLIASPLDGTLATDGYVAASVSTRTTSYALVTSCTGAARSGRVLGVGPAGVRVVVRAGAWSLLSDGRSAWAVVRSPVGGRAALRPLTGGPLVDLPVGFSPAGAYGGTVVGTAHLGDGTSVVVVDARTGSVIRTLGAASGRARVAGAVVLWTPRGCFGGGPCAIRRADLRTGVVTVGDCVVPRGARLGDAIAVAPDGRRIALLVGNRSGAPGYRLRRGDSRERVVVLDAVDCSSRPVEGLTLTPVVPVGAAFDPCSGALVIAVAGVGGTDVLVWRATSPRVELAATVPGATVHFALPVLVATA